MHAYGRSVQSSRLWLRQPALALSLLALQVTFRVWYCTALELRDANTLRHMHEIHPRPIHSKMIVASRHDEDTTWLDLYFSHIPHVVVQVDDPKYTVGMEHATPANKGREALAYLQFIVTYWDRLPASIVFAHGHRSAWHMSDIVPVLQRLRWHAHGFANLRYGPNEQLDWACGPDQYTLCNFTGGEVRPGDLKSLADRPVNDPVLVASQDMATLWKEVLETELGPPPKRVNAPCCGCFTVTRDRILLHPEGFYRKLISWLLETPMSDKRSSIVFEYLWHMLFGEPAEIKPVELCSLLVCDEV